MPSPLDFALFAANSYAASNTDVSANVAKDNIVPLSQGWSIFANGASTTTGFLARAYKNAETNEIVIAYGGTTSEEGMKTLDWTKGNLPAATGASLAQQIVDATRFYLDVLKASQDGNPPPAISFTGHSLGGGLASLMAVYFDKDAWTFDQAPFEQSATTIGVVNELKQTLGKDYPLSALAPEFSDYAPQTHFTQREQRVRHTYVAGEVLRNFPAYVLGLATLAGGPLAGVALGGYALASSAEIAAPDATIKHPKASGVGAVDLHDMRLLVALMQSPAFEQASRANPDFLRQVYRSALNYDQDDVNNRSFLNLMLQQEVLGNKPLDRLAEDIGKFKGTLDPVASGMVGATDALKAALYQLTIALYYGQGIKQTGATASPFSNLIASVNGGIQFSPDRDPARVPDYRSALRTVLEELASYDRSVEKFLDPGAGRYSLPTEGAMTVSALIDDKADVMLGSNLADRLSGGVGNDTLLGRMGADTLDGGAGDDVLFGGGGEDTLIGGLGDDLYVYSTGDGADTLIESREADGKLHGRIRIDGEKKPVPVTSLFIKSEGGQNTWRAADGSQLTLSHNSPWKLAFGDGGSFQLGETEADFQDGDFGLHLFEEAPAPTTTRSIVGDFEALDANLVEPEIQTTTDDLGNIVLDARKPQANRDDTFNDSAGNDRIDSGGGNDMITATRGGNDHILAGEGNDWVQGGAGASLIEGGAGNDALRGEDGNDRLFGKGRQTLEVALQNLNGAASGQRGDFVDGGAGDDLVVGDTGNDALFGGLGDDILVAGAGDDDIEGDSRVTHVALDWAAVRSVTEEAGSTVYRIDYTGAGVSTATPGGADVIYAGAGADWVRAGHGRDYVDGGQGDDVLFGQGGGDDLFGGAGNDVLSGDDSGHPVETHGADYLDGGEGDDKLFGGGGADMLLGDVGADLLSGGDGDDYADGGDGDDNLIGAGGADELFGGIGNDTLTGDSPDTSAAAQGADYLDGEDGNDILIGGGGADELFGGTGNDELYGESASTPESAHGADYLDGEDGDDLLVGGGGADVLYGGSGNDALYGEASDTPIVVRGEDYLDGGDGNDTLAGAGAADILIGGLGDDLLLGDDAALDPLYHGNDRLDGGDGNDTLLGGGGGDQLAGGAGNDMLGGEAGDDVAAGGIGDDVLDGGDGNDILAGEAGFDQLQGGTGDDLLDGGADNDTLIGEVGNDTLLGMSGSDILDGGDGDDVLDGAEDADQLQAGAGNDALYGGEGDDVLLGQDGNDWQDGGAGNDILLGDDPGAEAGDDVLLGGEGNDYLDGGKGSDLIDGGDGNDTLYSGGGMDTLAGGLGDDTIIIDGGGVKHLTDIGGNDSLFITGIDFRSTVLRLGSLLIDTGTPGNEIHIDDFDPTNPLGSGSIEFFQFADGAYSYSELLAKGIVIDGTAADEDITGTGVDDRITGGAGNDVLRGGAGNDRYLFNAGDGSDTIIDAEGGNTLVFGDGITAAGVSLGLDAISGSLSLDTGNDRIAIGTTSSAAIQRLEFANGDSIALPDFMAQRGVEILGTPGADNIVGTLGDDRIRGMAGVDTLQGSGGIDTYLYNRGDGADFIHDAGFNAISFGPGITADGIAARYINSKLVLDLGNGDTIDIGTLGNPVPDIFNTSPFEWPSISHLSFADGSTVTVADLVMSRGLVQTGGAGADNLTGVSFYEGLLPDRLEGKAGADTLRGGIGNDIYVFGRGDGADRIIDTAGSNTLEFGSGIAASDITPVWKHDNWFIGQRPSLALNLGGGDSVDLGETPGVQIIRFADGSQIGIGDLLAQRGVTNTSSSVHFGEEWFAYPGYANVMSGQAGDDRIYGDSQADTITGGTGNDVLSGREGADTYVYNRGDGRDAILDFHADGNVLRLGAGIALGDITPAWQRNGTFTYSLTLNVPLGRIQVGTLNDPSITTIQFADGTSLGLGDLLRLKGSLASIPSEGNDAMANFSDGAALLGLGGNDTLLGYATDDLLDGGGGDDLLVGGRGNDTYRFNAGDGSDRIEDFETLYDGRHDFIVDINTLAFGPGIAPESLRPVFDPASAEIGFELGDFDRIIFGIDRAPAIQQVSFADGEVFGLAETIARAGGFRIIGTDLIDWASGTPFVDVIELGAENDSVGALEGDDLITGGPGDDLLNGDLGNDTYYFRRGDGNDVIQDGIYGPLGEGVMDPETNTLVFLDDIAPANVTLDASDQYNLTLRVDSGESVSIGPEWYPAIQRIVYGNGLSFSLDETIAGKPVALPLADQVTSQGASFNYALPAQALADPNGDAVTYSVTAAYDPRGGYGLNPMTWLSFDSVTRTFSGNPDNRHVGSAVIGIVATDFQGNQATSTFNLQVLNVNDAPTVLVPMASQLGNWRANLPFSFTFNQNTFQDIDAIHGDRLIYSATQVDGSPLPTWLGFDPATRRFSGLPTNADARAYSLRLTAADTGGLSAASDFTLNVLPGNSPPAAAVQIADQAGYEDAAFDFVVPATAFTDPDGDVLSYVASQSDGAALPAWLSFDPATQRFSGTPGNSDVGTRRLRLTASDATGATAATEFKLEVINVNDAPLPVDDMAAVEEDATLVLPQATLLGNDTDIDPTADVLRITAVDAANHGTVALDDGGQVRFTPEANYSGPAGFSYTVTDGRGGIATGRVDIEVLPVNDIPFLVTPLPDQAIAGGARYNWALPVGAFTDIDTGDVLSYSASLADESALPSWLVFNAAARTFSGTAPTAGSTLDIKVMVTDGRGEASVASDLFRLVASPASTGGGGCEEDDDDHGGHHGDDDHDGHHGGHGGGHGHHGHGRDDDDRDEGHGKDRDRRKRDHDDDHRSGHERHKPKSYLDPRLLADYGNGERQADKGRGATRDEAQTFARWLAADQAMSRLASGANRGAAWQDTARGADIGNLAKATGAMNGSRHAYGEDAVTLMPGAGLKAFKGLQEGVRRLG
jgi:Ca2+-binding RTX toxin-like protein